MGISTRISASICDISHMVLPHASSVFQNRMAAFFPRKASDEEAPSSISRSIYVFCHVSFGKDLFPHLKVPLDVRCLRMKLNHWNIISAELPTIYDSERFLFLLCTNFMSTSYVS